MHTQLSKIKAGPQNISKSPPPTGSDEYQEHQSQRLLHLEICSDPKHLQNILVTPGLRSYQGSLPCRRLSEARLKNVS